MLSYPAPSRSAFEVSSSFPDVTSASSVTTPPEPEPPADDRDGIGCVCVGVVVVVASSSSSLDDSIGTSCRGSTSTFDCLRCLSRCGLWWSRAWRRRAGGGDAVASGAAATRVEVVEVEVVVVVVVIDAERRASASAVLPATAIPRRPPARKIAAEPRESLAVVDDIIARARGQIPAERMRGRRGCRQLLPVGRARDRDGRLRAPPRRRVAFDASPRARAMRLDSDGASRISRARCGLAAVTRTEGRRRA